MSKQMSCLVNANDYLKRGLWLNILISLWISVYVDWKPQHQNKFLVCASTLGNKVLSDSESIVRKQILKNIVLFQEKLMSNSAMGSMPQIWRLTATQTGWKCTQRHGRKLILIIISQCSVYYMQSDVKQTRHGKSI